MIPCVQYGDSRYEALVERIVNRDAGVPAEIHSQVAEIVAKVRQQGDQALAAYTEHFDGFACAAPELEIPPEQWQQAWQQLPTSEQEALSLAAERIRSYHEEQREKSWWYQEEDGLLLGQLVRPLQRVGIYVPGGRAAYPSSVLMNAVPAQVAGVNEIIMAVPAPEGQVQPQVLAAAYAAGVTRIFRMGGAQAVAALAYGTETVPRVDKITGPGNIYVATAKRQVFGQVDIDMIAGPSEILIVNDGSGSPQVLAADLLSQAEHDPMASAVLVTTSKAMAQKVEQALEDHLQRLPKGDIARQALQDYGALIVAPSLEAGVALANRIATEHLELAVQEPYALLHRIQNAGAIFLGHHTPEALGDYLAGPNHTLPTGGTARFSSPLGVADFCKRSSLLGSTQGALERLGPAVQTLARMEALQAHGDAVSVRLQEAQEGSQ